MEGFIDRRIEGLPKNPCVVEIITHDGNQYQCVWKPFNESEVKDPKPYEGYLGTAEVITGEYKGIGFHAWAQNVSEFVYYKVVI